MPSSSAPEAICIASRTANNSPAILHKTEGAHQFPLVEHDSIVRGVLCFGEFGFDRPWRGRRVSGMKQILVMMAVVLVGCGGDPNKKANELFVEAVQLIASGDEQTGEAAIKDYEQALGKLGEIIANHKESDLAVKLISGETLFTGKSLKEIKERVKELKRVAAAERVKELMRVAASEAERVAAAETERVAAMEARAEAERVAAAKRREGLEKALDRIKDPVEKAIRGSLELPTGELTEADLEKVTRLDLAYKQLTDVPKGLEKLTQLK